MEDVRILQVVVPAPSQDLVALDDVRDELGAPTSENARLQRYITAASSVISTYTRRIWIAETVTETFYASYFTGGAWGAWGAGWSYGWRWQPYRRVDGKPTPLVLARYPVSSIVSVIEGGDPSDPTDDPPETLDPTDYLLDNDKGLVYRWDGEKIIPMAWGMETVAVTYTAGFATDEVPPDVQQACMIMIRQRYFSRGRDPYLRSIAVPGVQEESYWAGPDQSALPPESAGLLDRHIDMRM